MLKNKAHDVTLLILGFTYLFVILFSNTLHIYLEVTFLAFLNIVLFCRFKQRYVVLFILTLMPGLIAVFIMALLFTRGHFAFSSTPGPRLSLLYGLINIPFIKLMAATTLIARVFSLAICSFIFVLHIDFEHLLMYAMQKWKLPTSIGYSLLAVKNAFIYLEEEFFHLRVAYRMRFNRNIGLFRVLLPLLISTSQYANSCGISLDARGLNPYKTFILQSKSWHYNNAIVILINWVIVLLLIKLG